MTFKPPVGLSGLNTKITRPKVDDEAQPERAEAPSLVSDPPRGPRTKAQAAKPARATTEGGAEELPKRLSVHLYGDELSQARGAFLTDWNLGGTSDTFNAWIEAAIVEHCRLTSKQRAALAQKHEPTGTGKQASFSLEPATAIAIRDAMGTDQRAGEWNTRSTFARPAIVEAIEQVKKRSGGHLETPPRRLPNRLTR